MKLHILSVVVVTYYMATTTLYDLVYKKIQYEIFILKRVRKTIKLRKVHVFIYIS